MAEVDPPRPLARTDDRSTFDCGRLSLNTWFQQRAWGNQEAEVSRTNIIRETATGTVVGYVSLAAGQIEREYLPRSSQRNMPNPVPVTLLGQLAVDLRFQRQGHASGLIAFALRTAVRASRDIASFGVVTHPLEERLRSFYADRGFRDLPRDPRGAMIARMIDLERSGFA